MGDVGEFMKNMPGILAGLHRGRRHGRPHRRPGSQVLDLHHRRTGWPRPPRTTTTAARTRSSRCRSPASTRSS
ncbi:hypothetical protein ACRAWD_29670 [Caulobacter segnis]